MGQSTHVVQCGGRRLGHNLGESSGARMRGSMASTLVTTEAEVRRLSVAQVMSLDRYAY